MQSAVDDIHLMVMICTINRDDMPLLSQWIKNRQVKACRFFGRNDVHTLEPPLEKCLEAFYYKGLSHFEKRLILCKNVKFQKNS